MEMLYFFLNKNETYFVQQRDEEFLEQWAREYLNFA